MADAYVPITINNHSGVVISCTVTYDVSGVEQTLKTGNYPAKNTKTEQLILTAENLVATVDYEAFIGVWRHVGTVTYPAGAAGLPDGLVLDITGPDGHVHLKATPPPPPPAS